MPRDVEREQQADGHEPRTRLRDQRLDVLPDQVDRL
jgi:hypothetical protein